MDQYDSLNLANQLCFPLYAASRETIKLYHAQLESLNLTYTQYIALMVLWEHGTLSVRDMGKMLFLDSGTLTPVLKSMEAKGFVSRTRCTHDERVVMVSLTPEGEAMKDRALFVPEEMKKQVSLNQTETLQLYRLLYKLLGVESPY